MEKQTVNVTYNYSIGQFIYFLCALATALIGHKIHDSVFWSIIDFFFAPLAWLKWMICQEVNLSIIKSAFAFFLQ